MKKQIKVCKVCGGFKRLNKYQTCEECWIIVNEEHNTERKKSLIEE